MTTFAERRCLDMPFGEGVYAKSPKNSARPGELLHAAGQVRAAPTAV
jgi:hypothetical protein